MKGRIRKKSKKYYPMRGVFFTRASYLMDQVLLLFQVKGHVWSNAFSKTRKYILA
jgi:hypothetical protein